MSIFDPGLPSVRQIQSFIKSQQKVEITLVNNISLTGKILWQDPNCIFVVKEDEDSKILVWFQAIVYLQPVIGSE